MIPKLDKNKRTVLIEKFIVPSWMKIVFKHYEYALEKNDYKETYRIILRVLNGAVVTIKKNGEQPFIEAHLNKWLIRGTEKINPHLANLLVLLKVIGLDSGNEETKEEHYTVFAASDEF